MVAVSVTQPASPFAALLRRSKFAAHDPGIKQVYTAYGGDAYRGNFGLKRPVPLRKRQPFITVDAVDSRQSQTVWKNAVQPARFIQMWDEVSIPLKSAPSSAWHVRLGYSENLTWKADSEFGGNKYEPPSPPQAEAAKGAEGEAEVVRAEAELGLGEKSVEAGDSEAQSAMEQMAALEKTAEEVGLDTPIVDTDNVHAMSDGEFQTYLTKLRELRPKFKRFVEVGEAILNPHHPRSLYQFSQTSHNLYRLFLSAQAHFKYNSPDSLLIQQQPHLNAGLTYPAMSKLQNMFYRKPMPGRIVNRRPTPDRRVAFNTVSFAGLVAQSTSSIDDHIGIDWANMARTGERDPSQGVSAFRIHSAGVYAGPTIVGEKRNPSAMKGASMYAMLQDKDEPEFHVGNPHRPGTVDYIKHQEGADATPSHMIPHRRYNTPPTTTKVDKEQSQGHGEKVIQTLDALTGLLGTPSPKRK